MHPPRFSASERGKGRCAPSGPRVFRPRNVELPYSVEDLENATDKEFYSMQRENSKATCPRYFTPDRNGRRRLVYKTGSPVTRYAWRIFKTWAENCERRAREISSDDDSASDVDTQSEGRSRYVSLDVRTGKYQWVEVPSSDPVGAEGKLEAHGSVDLSATRPEGKYGLAEISPSDHDPVDISATRTENSRLEEEALGKAEEKIEIRKKRKSVAMSPARIPMKKHKKMVAFISVKKKKLAAMIERIIKKTSKKSEIDVISLNKKLSISIEKAIKRNMTSLKKEAKRMMNSYLTNQEESSCSLTETLSK